MLHDCTTSCYPHLEKSWTQTWLLVTSLSPFRLLMTNAVNVFSELPSRCCTCPMLHHYYVFQPFSLRSSSPVCSFHNPMNRIDVISLPSCIKHKSLKKSVFKMRSVYLAFKRYGWVQKFIEKDRLAQATRGWGHRRWQ